MYVHVQNTKVFWLKNLQMRNCFFSTSEVHSSRTLELAHDFPKLHMEMGESSCSLNSLSPLFLRVGENITQDEDISEKMPGKSSKCGCLSRTLPFPRDGHQSLLKSINLLEGEDLGQTQKLRFTEAQTQHLEATFERQPRPDAPKKRRLAAELGVQVRQVEVWFQNRRARGRSSKCTDKKNMKPEQQQQQLVASEREAFRRRCQELLVHNHELHSLIQIERSELQLQLALCNSCKQVQEQ